MYTPQAFAMEEEQITAFLRQYSFGLLVDAELEAAHLPFVFDPLEGKQGALISHCAKANPLWQTLDGTDVLCVFSGPHAYISPTHYVSRPAVPTWNYASVHVKGVARVLKPSETMLAIEQMLDYFEPDLLEDNEVITDKYRERLGKAIVGLRIDITSLQGKLKLGQNRSQADQQSLRRHLEARAGVAGNDYSQMLEILEALGAITE